MTMSHITRFFRIVLFGLIVCCCLLNIYQSRVIIFEGTEFGLQVTIEYLNDVQWYVRRLVTQSKQSNFCKEDCKGAKVNNNYDLSQYERECPHHRYTTRIIERYPLIIYIDQFLTENEAQYLIELAEPFYEPSMVNDANGSTSFHVSRTSSTAFINSHHTPIVECIERRFAQFQGDIDLEKIEPLQVVKYTTDQKNGPHVDWLSNPDHMLNGGQRVTSFFTYLRANCSRGETEFTNIRFDESWHKRFCDILICDEKSTEFGIRFRPLAGNSIFWFNMNEQGQVDFSTRHAGRPPGVNGHKIGLNTWTREDRIVLEVSS